MPTAPARFWSPYNAETGPLITSMRPIMSGVSHSRKAGPWPAPAWLDGMFWGTPSTYTAVSAPCVPCVAKPRMRKPLPVSPWSMLLATTPGTRRKMFEMSRPTLSVPSSSGVMTVTPAGRPVLSAVTCVRLP